jgi:hypothetical protein
MQFISSLSLALLSLIAITGYAQPETPKGFKKGSIILADGHHLDGFVKDNMRNDASIAFTAGAGSSKKSYSGNDLGSVEIEGTRFTCIRGDFFKILCEGALCFLQKSSDASGKPSYNGNEAIFSSGTEGRPNDYFIYNDKTGQLTLVTRKNLGEVAANCFAGHTAAIEKAKSAETDLSQVKAAVEMYNAESR